MNIELRKPVAKIKLGNVYKKAVKGNKMLQMKLAEMSRSPIPISIENISTQIPELLQNLMKVKEINIQAENLSPKETGISITEPKIGRAHV